MKKKSLKLHLLWLLTLPIARLATAIGFCTSYLVNKNDFQVSSSTSILLTGSPAEAKINCLAENFDFKNLTVEEAIEKSNNEGVNNWLFNNISRLLDGNLDNINNANSFKNIKLYKSFNNNKCLVVSFIVDAGKVFDQNNKPTIKDTFYEGVIQGFATKNVVSFDKTELKTNSFNAKTFDLNDETIYTAKPLFTNQWLFDNRAKLFIGSLDQLTSINDFTLRNTSIKNPTSISINFDVAKNKLYDANGNLNSEITSFTIDITDFIIAKETYLETEYDASSVALDQYNVYEAKAIITPYFIFEHKDILIKGNSEIKNQSDITNVNVSIIHDNGTNLETKTTNNGSEISDVSKIASTSVSVTFDVAANKVYDENGYISTETKQFTTKIINLQKVGTEASKSKFEKSS